MELLHHRRHPAGPVQILQMVGAAGAQVAEVRRLLGYLVEEIHVQVDTRFPGDGRHVQHRVGGAAQGHIYGNGVLKGFQGGDLPGQNLFVHQLHDLKARFFGQAETGGVDGRDGAVPGEGQTDGFTQAVHGVGGEHAGAGTAPGTGALGQFGQLRFAHPPGFHRAHALEHRNQVNLAVLVTAGQHGAAADEDGGDVEAQRRHEHTGHDLVAVGHQHQPVEGVGHGHDFDGITDELPGGQGVFHPLVVHGQAVADADDPEFQGRPPGQAHPGFHRLGDFVQMDVAGDEFIKSVGHPDEGLVNLPVGKAHGLKKCAVRIFFQA